MAGLCCSLVQRPTTLATPIPIGTATRKFQCCCSSGGEAPNNKRKTNSTPKLLSLAVSGLTEILRLVSSSSSSQKARSDSVNTVQRNEVSVASIDDVLMLLKLDYTSSYFVTGNFTPALYSEDCLFEDPTIKFRGTQLYSRNLKLLVPFFENPSLVLKKIEKGSSFGIKFVLANWELRTSLRLPWRPFISIDGSTVYELDEKFKQIIRHTESWDISALEAVGQIFRPKE